MVVGKMDINRRQNDSDEQKYNKLKSLQKHLIRDHLTKLILANWLHVKLA